MLAGWLDGLMREILISGAARTSGGYQNSYAGQLSRQMENMSCAVDCPWCADSRTWSRRHDRLMAEIGGLMPVSVAAAMTNNRDGHLTAPAC